jgi:hypothetical protein
MRPPNWRERCSLVQGYANPGVGTAGVPDLTPVRISWRDAGCAQRPDRLGWERIIHNLDGFSRTNKGRARPRWDSRSRRTTSGPRARGSSLIRRNGGRAGPRLWVGRLSSCDGVLGREIEWFERQLCEGLESPPSVDGRVPGCVEGSARDAIMGDSCPYSRLPFCKRLQSFRLNVRLASIR